MEFPLQKLREMTFQLLFSLDMGENFEEELVPFLMKELRVPKRLVNLSLQKALSVWENKEELDRAIGETSQEYAFDRIQRVERNILRLGLYELKENTLEVKIIISEALRLCRKFSTSEGSSYINAILDEYSVSLREKQKAL